MSTVLGVAGRLALGSTRLPVLAALHAALVAWAAWYVVEMEWALAPLSASPTPLGAPGFVAAWVSGTLLLAVAGVLTGAGAGRWTGPDPRRVLPLGPGRRLVVAWAESLVVLALVAAAPLPVYLALHELGAAATADLAWPAVIQGACVLLAPLAGALPGALRRSERLAGRRPTPSAPCGSCSRACGGACGSTADARPSPAPSRRRRRRSRSCSSPPRSAPCPARRSGVSSRSRGSCSCWSPCPPCAA